MRLCFLRSIQFRPLARPVQSMYTPSVTGNQLLRFDRAWIAAARQVIEHNLRNSLKSVRHRDVLRAGRGSRSLHLGWASSRATTEDVQGHGGVRLRWCGRKMTVRHLSSSPGVTLNTDLGCR